MKAEDTVMTQEQLENLESYDRDDVLLAQAKISFEAGIKEVVEWINEVKGEESYTDSEYQRRISILLDKEAWQSKLKEWGIE